MVCVQRYGAEHWRRYRRSRNEIFNPRTDSVAQITEKYPVHIGAKVPVVKKTFANEIKSGENKMKV